jgi:hypothetical protein
VVSTSRRGKNLLLIRDLLREENYELQITN